MDINSLYVTNKLLIEGVFAILFVFLTMAIYKKTNNLYQFSQYQPIKFFSLSFLLYGFGVIVRFLRVLIYVSFNLSKENLRILHVVDLSLISIAGFLLLYSIIWKNKKVEFRNIVLLLLITFSIISVYTDYFIFTYLPQVIIFFIASIKCYKYYIRKKKKTMPKLFFYTMVLNLIVWASFLINWFFLNFYPVDVSGLIYISSYFITLIIFTILFQLVRTNLNKF